MSYGPKKKIGTGRDQRIDMIAINDAINWIYDKISSMKLLDGREIEWEHGPFGTRPILRMDRISSGGGSSTGAIPFIGKITGGSSSTGYTVDLYDEVNGSVIGTATSFPVMLHIGETIPNGSWILVFRSTASELTLE